MSMADLQHRITFQKRTETNDGHGNRRGAWEDQFTVWGGVAYRNGGEGVLAARLEATQPAIIKVRALSQPATQAIRPH